MGEVLDKRRDSVGEDMKIKHVNKGWGERKGEETNMFVGRCDLLLHLLNYSF